MLPELENPVPPGLIFDSHAHYDDERFDGAREELLSSLPAYGVCGVINCASDYATAEQSLRLARDFPFVWAAVGVHPHETAGGLPDKNRLAALAARNKAVAIGEIGLDYHYDFSPRERQLLWFEEQIRLALELNLPVIVHDREAHADTLDLLKKYRPRGVVHCFSGSAELAGETVKLGLYIGLGGAVTFKNARKPVEVAAMVPDDRLLVETDAPYMTPVPYRGKPCTSAHIAVTAERIAEIRGVERDALLAMTRDNARELFRI